MDRGIALCRTESAANRRPHAHRKAEHVRNNLYGQADAMQRAAPSFRSRFPSSSLACSVARSFIKAYEDCRTAAKPRRGKAASVSAMRAWSRPREAAQTVAAKAPVPKQAASARHFCRPGVGRRASKFHRACRRLHSPRLRPARALGEQREIIAGGQMTRFPSEIPCARQILSRSSLMPGDRR